MGKLAAGNLPAELWRYQFGFEESRDNCFVMLVSKG